MCSPSAQRVGENGDVHAAKAPFVEAAFEVPGSLDEKTNGGPPGASVVSGSLGVGRPAGVP